MFRVWFATHRPPGDHDFRYVDSVSEDGIVDAELQAAQIVTAVGSPKRKREARTHPEVVMVTRVEAVE